MSLGKKFLWTIAVLIILCTVGFAFLKWVVINMDVVYSEYPTISEYQERGWVPFSPETLKEAQNIRAKTDVSSNDSFIRFDVGMEDLENFIKGAKEESKEHQTVQCQDNSPECVLFKNDPDQIIRFDLVETSHLRDHEFIFLLDPESGEVVGGGQEFPFREYLIFD
jgi:hypothetical protein